MVSSAYVAFFIVGVFILHKLSLYNDFLMIAIMAVSGILIMFSKNTQETSHENKQMVDYTNIIVFFILAVVWVIANIMLRIV